MLGFVQPNWDQSRIGGRTPPQPMPLRQRMVDTAAWLEHPMPLMRNEIPEFRQALMDRKPC